MRSERLGCLEVADDLAAVLDGHVLSPAAGSHVAECLRCQAELAQFRRLARALAELADKPGAVPSELEHEILLALDREHDRFRLRVPAVAAATLGGIAAAAGVIALATRGVSRQRRVARVAV